MKKFGKIEAKYLKNGYWSCWSSFPVSTGIFGANSSFRNEGDSLQEREKIFFIPPNDE